MTLAEIKAANVAAGNHFFDRDTMRFFGETMRDYRARNRSSGTFLVRIAGHYPDGSARPETKYELTQTGDLRQIDEFPED